MNLTFNSAFNVYQQNFTANRAINSLPISKLKELLAEGYTPAKISELTGMKERTIYSRIEDFGLETPTQAKRKRINSEISAIFKETQNISEIMKRAGVSGSTVEKWIKDNLHKTPAQMRQEKLVELLKSDLSEIEIAEKMNLTIEGVRAARKRHKINRHRVNRERNMEHVRNELSNGLSYREIAQKLNLSLSTIKTYAQEVKKNLNLQA